MSASATAASAINLASGDDRLRKRGLIVFSPVFLLGPDSLVIMGFQY
jgi:hypothetical protein